MISLASERQVSRSFLIHPNILFNNLVKSGQRISKSKILKLKKILVIAKMQSGPTLYRVHEKFCPLLSKRLKYCLVYIIFLSFSIDFSLFSIYSRLSL